MHELTRAALACVDAIEAHLRGLNQPSNWTRWAANANALQAAVDAFTVADSDGLRIFLAGTQPDYVPVRVVDHPLAGEIPVGGEGGLPEMFGERFPSHHHLAACAARLLLSRVNDPGWLNLWQDELGKLPTWLPAEIAREAAALEKGANAEAVGGSPADARESSKSGQDASPVATTPSTSEQPGMVEAATEHRTRNVRLVGDDEWLAVADIAELFPVPPKPLRNRLERFRRGNPSCAREIADRKPRAPKYLYHIGSIRHLIS